MKNIPVRQIDQSSKEPDFSGSFSIREVRHMLDGKDMVQKYHRHDFFYILALKKGSGKHEIDFTSYDVCDRSVFFMRPGQVHQLKLGAGSTGYLIEFKNNFYYPLDKASDLLFQKASNMNFYRADAKNFSKLGSILNYIFQEYTDKQEGYQEIIKANLGIFFIELIRQQGKKHGLSNNVSSYTQERLEEFLGLLERNVPDHKQVAQYAEMMNLSVYQLNAITKATLSKTCSELIDEHIILESKRYLLATSNQVNQISYNLGYEDVSYFIRFFKKHTGYTPEAFRNNFR